MGMMRSIAERIPDRRLKSQGFPPAYAADVTAPADSRPASKPVILLMFARVRVNRLYLMQIIKDLLNIHQLTVHPISGAKSPDPAQDNQASINKAARDAGRPRYLVSQRPPLELS